MRLRVLIVFICCSLQFALAQNNEALADDYYKKGDYEKALVIYKNLNKKSPYNYKFEQKLIETHQQLEQYNDVEQLLLKRLEKRRNPSVLVVLGRNYELKGDTLQAKNLYDEAISAIDINPNYTSSVAKKFEDYSLLEEAIRTYKKSEKLLSNVNYSIKLARIYGEQGKLEEMFSSYIDYIVHRPNYVNEIKCALSDFISEDNTNPNNKILRRALLKKIQQDPNVYWYEMLSWLYVQEKAYDKSLRQEKALYRRNPESLDRIIDLALIALDDNDNETAKDIFDFILETSKDINTILTAHLYILEIETKTATSKAFKAIDKKYNSLFDTYGKTENTLLLQLAYGEFLAFHQKDTNAAKSFLKQSLKLDLSQFQKAKVKLLLADVLVLQEKFNEALLYYSQIQVSLKNSEISQEARFRVAKTSYYKGDFDWAESQLKILKSSTSQLIANDALDLKLLISDNKYEDSTQTALKYYAKADLFAFQNKTDRAISLLDKVLEEHKGESITDQALYKQAKLFETKKQYKRAEVNYQAILKDYKHDILADDAKYYLAELYRIHLTMPEEAKALYEKIIFDHQDSIYFVEARKKFRKLRGDSISQ